MQFLGSVNFYSKFIEKLHINLKPLYTLLHDDNIVEWTPELGKIFQDVKNAMTADTELTIPNTKHPFFIIVDASLVGLGAVLFQMNETNNESYFLQFKNSQYTRTKTFNFRQRTPRNSFCIRNIRISHYWISSSNLHLYRSQTATTLFRKKGKP